MLVPAVQQGESVLRAHTLSFPCRSLRDAGEGPCAMHLFSHCCARLFFVPMDCSPPGSSVHGISQATVLEWVTISFPRGSSQPRDQTRVSCIGRQVFTTESPGKLVESNREYIRVATYMSGEE